MSPMTNPWTPEARARHVLADVLGRLPAQRNVRETERRLREAGGGYEIVHESPGLEIGVYVLVAPEPDHQSAHGDDEVYVVLEGSGVLTVEGQETALGDGDLVFVPAGADHRFTGYQGLSVLVIFARR
jgi:mannose-6-phosphate isomerase-like protein (cupin superfamily)